MPDISARIAALGDFLPKARRRDALEDLAAFAARGHVRDRRGDAVLPAHALRPALRAAAARWRHHQARDRRLGPHAAALCRRRRRDRVSAGLSAGAQRSAGGQLFGARHYLSTAQCARPPGLRLFAGAAGADDGQHRAAPPAVAARLLQRRLDPRRLDRRAANGWIVEAAIKWAVGAVLSRFQ